MSSYSATPHNPPLTHAGVNVTTGSAAREEMRGMEKEASESKSKKKREKAKGID